MTTPEERRRNADSIVAFQLDAANEWIAAARRISQPGDNKLQFIAYFTALNALYWLWGRLDNVESPEIEVVQHLIERLGERTAKRIVRDERVISFVSYLRRPERGPVRSMQTRTRDDPLGSSVQGSRYHEQLNSGRALTRLKALAAILYLVRCNIVHGSKRWTQTDNDLATNGLPVLQLIVEEAFRFSEATPPR